MIAYHTDTTNMADQIDMRDITDRVEHLEQLRQPGPVDLGEDDNECSQDDLFAELATLEALLEELKGNGGDHDWRGDWYPGGLIRDSYFETAMDELLEDIGDLPRDLPGYLKITVDYDALQMDYSSIEYDGVTYWYR